MNNPNIIYSAQVVIPAGPKEIYVETNNKYCDISFFGWKAKKWEKMCETAIREVYEETTLILWTEDLHFIESSDSVKLWHGIFVSSLYVTPVVPKLEWKWIQKISLKDLEKINAKFMVSKEDFLRRTNLALKNINRIYGT